MSTATAVGLRSRRRRLVAILALIIAAAVAATLSTVFTQAKSEAHGATVFPGSRQYFCYFDALTENGSLDPYNEACQSAFDQVGATPFYNWFGNLDANGAGQTVGYIPDGRLCDGGGNGPYDFEPFNDPGDWPRTHVTAGDTVEWRYNNWAHHPGRFDLYITKDGWNPDEPLAWDDLEQFTTIQDPPQSGGSGADENYYYAPLTLPQKSGYHIVFTHWVRSDSNENFYACSDVVFDGGDGEITGIRPGADLPGNDGGVTEPTETPTDDEPTTGGPTDGDCTAVADVSSWDSGATVQVTVTNTGDANMGSWMVHWLWPPDSGIEITQAWNTEISTMGDMQMASPSGWNASIASGESVNFGFNVSGALSSMPELDCMPD
ncbi:lytic polysaccharide monooxygenase [Glycomyces sp. L485]|uniref:lytic polysaccharide monooxygenase n=1 Tax=Glycomyces sp. L485 TaxID=2909235 RepID=UPI001F4A715C|nr:lytic polysaccharide monooxygenase [Glycomyces sp. L485]MCH7230666.1 lytic polysaccharide monooxygenase [Glycomyces sp. L485]